MTTREESLNAEIDINVWSSIARTLAFAAATARPSRSSSFMLPETVKQDKIDATYKDGILSVTIPKKEEAKQKLARNIKIA